MFSISLLAQTKNKTNNHHSENTGDRTIIKTPTSKLIIKESDGKREVIQDDFGGIKEDLKINKINSLEKKKNKNKRAINDNNEMLKHTDLSVKDSTILRLSNITLESDIILKSLKIDKLNTEILRDNNSLSSDELQVYLFKKDSIEKIKSEAQEQIRYIENTQISREEISEMENGELTLLQTKLNSRLTKKRVESNFNFSKKKKLEKRKLTKEISEIEGVLEIIRLEFKNR
jgi:hypothetical protein